MPNRNDTEVIIGGKVLTLSGGESADYLQKVASYINSKIEEVKRIDSYRLLPPDKQGIFLNLNIADDLFQARSEISSLEDEISAKEKELYNIKHELIASQIKLENTEKNVKNLENQLNEASKKILRLEASLKN